MKKIFISLLLALMLPWSAMAQDARGRVASTIVADALASLPAQKQKNYNSVMSDLASTGTEGVVQLCSMLVPADKGKNSTVEYALYGLASYVMAPGHDGERNAMREGLKASMEKCTDPANRAFLMTLLQNVGTADDASFFTKYVNDPYLQEWAINGLIAIPGTDDALMQLISTEGAPRELLALAAGKKGLKGAEPTLLNWVAGVAPANARSYYKALGLLGSSKSLPLLSKAAKAEGYAWVANSATEAYVSLLEGMAANGEAAAAVKGAKTLLKEAKQSNVRGAALNIIFAAEGKKALPLLVSAMKDGDRAYRVNALRRAEPWADDAVFAALNKFVKAKKPSEVQADILNWYGTNHAAGQIDAVVANFNSACPEVSAAAIKAAGKIGGEKALNALVAQLGGERSAQAEAALLAFNGKVNPGIVAAIDGSAAAQAAALKIAATRRMTEAAPKVFALLNSGDDAVKSAAYAALPGVVGPNDFDAVAKLVEAAGPSADKALLNALTASVRNLPKAEQYAKVIPFVKKSKTPYVYYNVLAQAATPEAVAALLDGFNKGAGQAKEMAFNALLNVNTPDMINVLYGIATSDKAREAKAMNRYAALVNANETMTPMRKYQLFRKGIESASDAGVKNTMIAGLASTNTYPALMVVKGYLGDKATAHAAASAVRAIVSKNVANFGGAPVKEALEGARDVFKASGSADDGYAVDDINGMLPKIPQSAFNPIIGTVNLKSLNVNPADGKVLNAAGLKALKPADAKKAKAQAAADFKQWNVEGTTVAYNGQTPSAVAFDKELENFELMLEWKGCGTLGVRSMPVIALGCGEGKSAANPEGEWNTTYVKVVNDRMTVVENGVTLVDNKTIVNPYGGAPEATGMIELASCGKPLAVREVMVRELPSTPIFKLSPEEEAEGFKVLFDGRSMHNFTGNTTDYIPVDGNIYVSAAYGNGGNLYTVDEYSDFIYRFEFCFDVEGVNNGVGIRTPMGVDAAYQGMEIQILDHDAPIYKGLKPHQVHGSVYGIIPAKRIVHRPRGEWGTEEIRAIGDSITVTVNGEVILSGNIREACQGHNVAPDGGKENPYTVDHRNHPGLFNKSGHIGFLGHGAGVKFRNIRIKDLSAEKKVEKKGAKTAKK